MADLDHIGRSRTKFTRFICNLKVKIVCFDISGSGPTVYYGSRIQIQVNFINCGEIRDLVPEM